MGLEIRNGLIVPNLKQFSMEIKPSVKTRKRGSLFLSIAGISIFGAAFLR